MRVRLLKPGAYAFDHLVSHQSNNLIVLVEFVLKFTSNNRRVHTRYISRP